MKFLIHRPFRTIFFIFWKKGLATTKDNMIIFQVATAKRAKNATTSWTSWRTSMTSSMKPASSSSPRKTSLSPRSTASRPSRRWCSLETRILSSTRVSLSWPFITVGNLAFQRTFDSFFVLDFPKYILCNWKLYDERVNCNNLKLE